MLLTTKACPHHSPGRRAGCPGRVGTAGEGVPISHPHSVHPPRAGLAELRATLPNSREQLSPHTPAKCSRVFLVRMTNTDLLLNYISVRSGLSLHRKYY